MLPQGQGLDYAPLLELSSRVKKNCDNVCELMERIVATQRDQIDPLQREIYAKCQSITGDASQSQHWTTMVLKRSALFFIVDVVPDWEIKLDHCMLVLATMVLAGFVNATEMEMLFFFLRNAPAVWPLGRKVANQEEMEQLAEQFNVLSIEIRNRLPAAAPARQARPVEEESPQERLLRQQTADPLPIRHGTNIHWQGQPSVQPDFVNGPAVSGATASGSKQPSAPPMQNFVLGGLEKGYSVLISDVEHHLKSKGGKKFDLCEAPPYPCYKILASGVKCGGLHWGVICPNSADTRDQYGQVVAAMAARGLVLYSSANNAPAQGANNNSGGQCFFCKGEGHWFRQCPYRK